MSIFLVWERLGDERMGEVLLKSGRWGRTWRLAGQNQRLGFSFLACSFVTMSRVLLKTDSPSWSFMVHLKIEI